MLALLAFLQLAATAGQFYARTPGLLESGLGDDRWRVGRTLAAGFIDLVPQGAILLFIPGAYGAVAGVVTAISGIRFGLAIAGIDISGGLADGWYYGSHAGIQRGWLLGLALLGRGRKIVAQTLSPVDYRFLG